MSSEAIYCLYKHTSPSGKSYIGITCNYTARCQSHQRDPGCRAFYNAIQKYGWDNFTHTILAEDMTDDEAWEMEVWAIQHYASRYPTGYNIKPGGQGCITDASRNKLSQSLSGRILDDDHINKIAASCADREHTLEMKIKAYMARWKKTRAEAEEFYEKKATDPYSVNKNYGKDYVGYAAVKRHNQFHRSQKRQALNPNS